MVTLRKLASLVGGKVVGAPDQVIHGVSDIKNGAPDTITFLFNSKHQDLINKTPASAIILSDAALLQGKSGIIVDNPRLAMAKVLKIFELKSDIETGTHPTAIIHESAKIGKNTNIGAFSIIRWWPLLWPLLPISNLSPFVNSIYILIVLFNRYPIIDKVFAPLGYAIRPHWSTPAR